MGVVSSDWNEIRGTHRVNTTTMNEFLRYCSTLYGEGSCLLNAGDDGMSSICGFLNEFEKDEIRWVICNSQVLLTFWDHLCIKEYCDRLTNIQRTKP